MNEFVDTNVFFYAHEPGGGRKREISIDLIKRLVEEETGSISIQVLVEFYSVAISKLRLSSRYAEAVLHDLGEWYFASAGLPVHRCRRTSAAPLQTCLVRRDDPQ
jgi:predicted nucleic acid-binding protein